MPTTTVNAIPYPDLATPAQPDVPADLQALAVAVDRKLVTPFANATARDAAVTSPVDGQGLYYLADVDQYTARVNGAWVQVPVANSTWQDPAAATAGLRTIGPGAAQAAQGTLMTHALAMPGTPYPGLETASATLTGSLADVVAAPATSHIRVVKNIQVAAGSTAPTIAATIGATSIMGALPLTANGVAGIGCSLVLTAGEALRFSGTSGADITATYVDLLAAAMPVTRLGLASGSGSGTLVNTGASTRWVAQVWVANLSASTAGTATLTVGGKKQLDAVALQPGGLALIDGPIALTSSGTITYAATGASMAWIATGWTES